jgi:multiple antibiotic resistance protein
MTVLIVASGSVDSVAGAGLVVGLILAVGALDWFYFTNMQVISKRVNPATLVISEVVFGILLTALAVELIVHGLTAMGLLAAAGH